MQSFVLGWRSWRRLAVVVVLALPLSLFASGPVAAGAYDPGPVTNVTATTGSGTLAVSWSPANPGAGTSIVEYTVQATSAGLTGTLATCRTQTTSCTLTGLENGRAYYIQVTARNNYYGTSNVWGAGPWTPCCSVPLAPASVAATSASETASVSWTPPTNASSTGPGGITYNVTSNPAGLACTTAALTCVFNSLVNGTTYTFYVTAQTSFGVSRAAQSGAVTPVGLPSAPSNVVGFLRTRGTVEVTWQGPDSTGGTAITGYVATASPGGANCTTSGQVTCSISGLSNGTGYTFTVVAQNAVGPGPASAPSPVAKVLAGPGVPSSIKARAGRGTATVTWKAPKSTGGLKISKYTVKASPSGKTCSSAKLTCSFSGLSDNTVYVFSVTAFNAKGAGIPGQSPAVRTDPTPPKPEAGVG